MEEAKMKWEKPQLKNIMTTSEAFGLCAAGASNPAGNCQAGTHAFGLDSECKNGATATKCMAGTTVG
jgi:hypothetical protein